MNIKETLKVNPLIAAAQYEGLKLAVNSKASAIILMNGKLNELMEPEFQEYNNRKNILLHADLIKGLSNDKEAINFIKKHIKAEGIVSTKGTMLRAAKTKGLTTIQRIFLIDTNSLKSAVESIKENDPDIVEIMPALVYPIIKTLKNEIGRPIILGGLINKKEQILDIYKSGADGVSCSKSDLWDIDFKNEEIK